MENLFKYSDDIKRYHTWNYHLRHKFGCKVFKVSLNAGFSCPNIDGTKGYGGCTYCSSSGSGDFAGNPEDDILIQFEKVREQLHKKWRDAKYIAYFQAHTNTYADVDVLKSYFEPVLRIPNVVGLSIATRADALCEPVLDYLSELNERTFLIVELGLQSVFDITGERINRCMSYMEFIDGYTRLKQKGIRVCVHLINGLPGETKEMMLHSAQTVALLEPDYVKLHLLHILKNTAMAVELEAGEVTPLTLEEYVDIVVCQLEHFSPNTVIQRITGDGAKEQLIAPLWSLKKFVVLNEIDKEMIRRGTYQGAKRKERLQ